MQKDDRLEIYTQREYKVVKANEIIQKARYDLSLSEIKAFSYIVSKVKPGDPVGTEYVFRINDYCKLAGINTNDKDNIAMVKKAVKSLRDKSFWITQVDGTETTVGWLDKAWINKGSGKIKVRFDEDMQKYITGLYENFTQYTLLCTLPMQSSYSIRIYELLKSYAFTKTHTFAVDQLKKLLGCENYVRFPDFRRKVLEIATREINEYTDLEVSWEPITQGRKVIEIKYHIGTKSAYAYLESSQKATDRLDGQISMFDYLSGGSADE